MMAIFVAGSLGISSRRGATSFDVAKNHPTVIHCRASSPTSSHCRRSRVGVIQKTPMIACCLQLRIVSVQFSGSQTYAVFLPRYCFLARVSFHYTQFYVRSGLVLLIPSLCCMITFTLRATSWFFTCLFYWILQSETKLAYTNWRRGVRWYAGKKNVKFSILWSYVPWLKYTRNSCTFILAVLPAMVIEFHAKHLQYLYQPMLLQLSI